jgi:hypothetical protein
MRWLGLLTVASLALSPVFAGDTPPKVKPVIVLTGTDSKQDKRSFARCLSKEEWRAIWHKQHGWDNRTCPEVDFDSYMVLAIFHGKESLNTGLDIYEVLKEKDRLRVRYQPRWYQVGYIRPPTKQDLERELTRSFAFVVLPRFEKEVQIEEDVQGILGKPPVWKERGKLAPIKKK